MTVTDWRTRTMLHAIYGAPSFATREDKKIQLLWTLLSTSLSSSLSVLFVPTPIFWMVVLAVFPCSSITVIPRMWIENSDDGNDASIFSSNSNTIGGRRCRRKRKSHSNASLANLIKPLQRFTKQELRMDDSSSNNVNGDHGFVMAFASSIKEDKLKFLEDVECYEDLDSRMVSMVPGRSNSSKWIRIIIEDRHSNKKNESKEGSKMYRNSHIIAEITKNCNTHPKIVQMTSYLDTS